MKEWSEDYGVAVDVIRSRINNGWDAGRAITETSSEAKKRGYAERKRTKPKPPSKWDQIIIHNGISKTAEQWAEENNKTKRAVNKRIRAGWSFEDAIFTPTRTAQKFTHDGKSLTMDEWSSETGIDAGTLWKRLSYGYTFDEAVTLPLNTTKSHKRYLPKTEGSETAQMADLLD